MADVTVENGPERHICPDDRLLSLMGRLETGWSTFPDSVYRRAHHYKVTEDDQLKIVSALDRAHEVDVKEQERIGQLVVKVKNIKKNVLGDGKTSCLICGVKTGFKEKLRDCYKCFRGVCPRCCVGCLAGGEGERRLFCVVCYEERELWKRSGAWFYNTMPAFITPSETGKEYSTFRVSLKKPSGNKGSFKSDESITSHRPSIITTDITDGVNPDEDMESSDESEDELSRHPAVSITSADRSSLSSFNLGIDVDESSIGENRKKHSTPMENRNSQSLNFMTPGDDTPADTPPTNKHLDIGIYDDADTNSFSGRLSPDRRSISDSVSSEAKRKRLSALKIRKKSAESKRSVTPTVGDSVSQSGTGDEDLDTIFKKYEMKKEPKDEKREEEPNKEFNGPLGMLEFTLQYDANTLELLVIVHCGKGLKAMDRGNTSDPYVKTHLLPGASKSTKKRTQTIQKTTNPVFNETLVYHGITEKDINHKVMRLSVMDENKIASNALIGEACVPLKGLNTRPVQHFRRLLDPESDHQAYEDNVEVDDSPGRIEIALHYLSKKQKLVVGIIRCAGLKAMDPNGYSDPYVKCYLRPGTSKKSKRKTAIKKKTLNPEFNEEFAYDVPHSELARRNLDITVWDYDVGTRNDFIGAVSLGINANGEALKHWFETLKTSDRRVTRWHTLSSIMPNLQDRDDMNTIIK